MDFRTQISLQKQPSQIEYSSEVLLMGSCFAEHIGAKLDYFKFKNSTNPFGILFHPLAIEKLILKTINEELYAEEDIFFFNEQWHCYDTHSSLSANSKEELLDVLNEAINSTNKQLNNSTHIIITLGTAWVYRFIESDSIVANCHKVSQKKFLKELLSVDAIEASLSNIVALVKSINPNINVLFTVSPVRHLKDGFIENSRSKAHLISAVQSIIEPRKKLYYFPSYEIMIDELRDYRFYSEDMIHPNVTAINYIWETFKNVWINGDAFSTMKKADDIQRGLSHRPFNPNSEQHKVFLQKLEEKKEKLQQEFPHIAF